MEKKNETGVLSLQIINALVTQNKSARTENNKNAKIGWNIVRNATAGKGQNYSLDKHSSQVERISKTKHLRGVFSSFVYFFNFPRFWESKNDETSSQPIETLISEVI